MKYCFFMLLAFPCLGASAQSTKTFVHYNTLKELSGTPFVIGSITSGSKKGDARNTALTFINTQTGAVKSVALPAGSYINVTEQLKLDTLNINKLLVSAHTRDVDGKNGIDWEDPTQLFLFSPNGEEQVQLTADTFFATHYLVNHTTGTLVATGYYDTHKNGRQDSEDQSEILVFDLRSGKQISSKE